MTELAIGATRTTLGSLTLDIGWSNLDADLENAIASIEDELARVGATALKEATMHSSDVALHALFSAAGIDPSSGSALSLGAVENLFTRLAAGGRGLPAEPRFSATVLILRELMHHLEVGSLLVFQPGAISPSS